jgi:hypothetical protein
VPVDAVSESSDANQLSKQIKKAEGVTGKRCEVACADSGYSNIRALSDLERSEVKIIVPSQKQASGKAEGPFSKSQFLYDKRKDCYYCPEGQPLIYSTQKDNGWQRVYRIKEAKICIQCKNYDICTKAKQGRTIIRLANEALKEKLKMQFDEEESQRIYARRKSKVEHPFGHIKHNLGIRHFLIRRRDGVQAEISLGATCFNLARITTLLGGVQGLVNRFRTMHG